MYVDDRIDLTEDRVFGDIISLNDLINEDIASIIRIQSMIDAGSLSTIDDYFGTKREGPKRIVISSNRVDFGTTIPDVENDTCAICGRISIGKICSRCAEHSVLIHCDQSDKLSSKDDDIEYIKLG